MNSDSRIDERDKLYVEVALPIPVRRTFTYRADKYIAASLSPGTRVLVPFGKRELVGFIVGIDSKRPATIDEESIRDIIDIVDPEPIITPEIFELARWTADYYAASFGEMLKATLPAGISSVASRTYRLLHKGSSILPSKQNSSALKWQLLRKIDEYEAIDESDLIKDVEPKSARRAIAELKRAGFIVSKPRVVQPRIKQKRQKAVRLKTSAREPVKPLSEAQKRILVLLNENGGEMLFTDLLEKAEISSSPLTTLAKASLIEIFTRDIQRDPLADIELPELDPIVLNTDQTSALDAINSSLRAEQYACFLLHGVTGSGKTEVYIRAMRETLSLGRTALMLVPEISLTPVFSRRLKTVFGEKVAILHSNLSPGERFDEWRRIRDQRASVVIGTRSAVFAPLDNPGIIIVDEEHDTSYRQNESPSYNGRDVAVKRAHSTGAVVVLGSATPAIESFHNAQIGKYRYLPLGNRIGGRPLAKVDLIDMREVFKSEGKDVIFSKALVNAVEHTHSRGEQTIILLNRRGFSSFVICRSCGERLGCKNCDIALTYHKADRKLVCHYCGYATSVPDVCPFCKSEYLYFIGHGTEQIAERLCKRFDHLRIERLDRDTARRKGEMARTILDFDKGNIDILVGTQMIAKGHDFQNVTLVGVVSVDAGLGLPDFRSAERTFQLLTQVAGRAGRGELPGNVLIQTYHPGHYALQFAAKQDYEGFYEQELLYRERFGYPPFTVLASVLFKHKNEDYARRSSRILRECMDRKNTDRSVRVLGPAPAPIYRIKNEFRYQLILRSTNRKLLRERIDSAMGEAEALGCDLRIARLEIDPMDIM
ncbi:primosomal protein N' [Leptolyngbya sp. 7M]|uniref:primosomal protein N' n=1 Tax=Leptolyngbya sp. 7M TaxID=2812896 RepID=UPI001B8D770E|nr:primosomal protein N' [Leptolyngbya sp. 7M]QYO66304.1 primosomal protein N' [Leptolyngbya sp. 7M]